MRLRYGLAVVAMSAAACGADGPGDLIDGFPPAQQETVRRSSWRAWPLSVVVGTLGCDRDAVVFRAAGTTYAVNDAARARGFAALDPILMPAPSPKPSNPLSRITQQDRTKIFEEASACGDRGCESQIRARYRLSEAELEQVKVEGRERVWPPLKRQPASTKLLLDRGLLLCSK